MPYVRIEEDVFIEPDEILQDCTADELIKELAKRGERVPDNLDAKMILGALKSIGCPPEIYSLVEEWVNGKLSLNNLLALANK